jgi:hypothetical protein
MLLEQSAIDDPEMTLELIRHGAVTIDKMPDGSDALYFAKQRGRTPSVTIPTRDLLFVADAGRQWCMDRGNKVISHTAFCKQQFSSLR